MRCLDDAVWLLPPEHEFAALGMGDLDTSYFDLGICTVRCWSSRIVVRLTWLTGEAMEQ